MPDVKEDAKKPEPQDGGSSFAGALGSLKSLEVSLSEAFVAYQGVMAKRAVGHAPHAAHNNHGTHASRQLGLAHGGVVQAIAALEAFASKHATADESHAAAEKAKAEKEASEKAAKESGK